MTVVPPPPLRVVIAEDAVLLREGLQPGAPRGRPRSARHRRGRGAAAATGRRATARRRHRRCPDAAHADHRGAPGGAANPPPVAGHGGRGAVHHVETELLFDLLADDPRGIGYVLKERVADIPPVHRRRSAPGRRGRVGDRPRGGLPAGGPAAAAQPAGNADRARARRARADGTGPTRRWPGQLWMSPKTVETHVGNISASWAWRPPPKPPPPPDHAAALSRGGESSLAEPHAGRMARRPTARGEFTPRRARRE